MNNKITLMIVFLFYILANNAFADETTTKNNASKKNFCATSKIMAKEMERKKAMNSDFYDFKLQTADNQELPLSNFKGKVVLIVNTATACGFTPQYEPLEAIYEKYHGQGFEIIDIPCNQFGSQAPGSDEEIKNFCQLNYHTKFIQIKKSDVNGFNELPLYTFLKSKKGFAGFGEGKTADFMREHLSKIDKNYANNSDIKWNFTKFVVDKFGNVIERFEPTADMQKVEDCVSALLKR